MTSKKKKPAKKAATKKKAAVKKPVSKKKKAAKKTVVKKKKAAPKKAAVKKKAPVRKKSVTVKKKTPVKKKAIAKKTVSKTTRKKAVTKPPKPLPVKPIAVDLQETQLRSAADMPETVEANHLVEENLAAQPEVESVPVPVTDKKTIWQATQRNYDQHNIRLNKIKKGGPKPSGKKPLW
jgi:hypothetical protein